MLTVKHYAQLGLSSIYDKVCANERLSFEDGEALFACPDIIAVGALAHHARVQRHGRNTHYVRNRQVNYSNICETNCRFCSFARPPHKDGAFTLTREEILAKVSMDHGSPFTEIHVVGGCHPTLPIEWFEETFRAIAKQCPNAILKGLTVTEVRHLAYKANITTAQAFARLRDAGVSMITGGGGEIFDPTIRNRICPQKISGDEYLRLAGEAHAAGLHSNCTMLFGHIESHRHRVDHLCRLRDQQDKTGGYMCFIPLAFQGWSNQLAADIQADTGVRPGGGDTAQDRLRTIAVSRLLLDNIPHIKAYWVMLGVKLTQLALLFGADDIDGTIEEEHIGRMAGAASDAALTLNSIEQMIHGSGLIPVSRDALFNEVILQTQFQEIEPKNIAPDLTHTQFSGSALHLVTHSSAALATVLKKADDGERLSMGDASLVYREADIFTLGSLAHKARMRKHPDAIVTYVGDRNINYTNGCVCGCNFCAFYCTPDTPGTYTISRDELSQKIQETIDLGGTQILLQGGHNPTLPLVFYENMLRWIREEYPQIHIHAFSPPEIVFFADLYSSDIPTIIACLKEAGLHSIPGGGAEILVDRVRASISPNKCSTNRWLEVMREAHKQGLKTTATMMFGHEETVDERLEHLFRLRDLQDETGGFTAFIPWTFQPQNTAMHTMHPETAPAYLRLLAMSRLVLDNFPSIQASWVTMGPEIAQAALHFGANDFGSLMIEENVVAAANVSYRMDRDAIHRVISAAGFTPHQRLMDYTLVDQKD